MKLRFVSLSLFLLAACVVEPDDQPAPCAGGKCDGASAPRTITIGADRRPVDGALVEIHLEHAGPDRWSVIREATYFDRREGREVHERETLVDVADCALGLDKIVCVADEGEDVVEITRAGDAYDAELATPAGAQDLGTGLALRHVRWSSRSADGTVELAVDATRDGHVGTLRTTAVDADVPEVRTLFTGAACAVGADLVLSCTEDRRPVDGALVELRVARDAYPSDYDATLRTSAQRLDGVPYDRTERFAALALR
jgi:hypothetical protein